MDIPKMNALAVRNLEEVSQTLRNDDNLYALLQQAYIKCAKYDQALAVQDQRDSINGYNEESAMFRYQFHMALNNTQLAIQEVERYLELDPSHIEFLQIRAGLYEVTQQPTHKLIEAYEALLPYDQNNAGLLNNLAWALCISNRDLQRAERLSMMAILSEPSNTTFLDTYAWIAYQLGDCEAALFFIDKAVENMTDENTTAEGKKEIKNHYKIIHKRCK
jgi:tetratricopeptide (TPR) repeat protein